MKNTMIAVLVSLVISSLAMADEKIQMTVAMGDVNGSATSTSDATVAGSKARAAWTGATANMVAVGVITAGAIASLAVAGSTPTHAH